MPGTPPPPHKPRSTMQEVALRAGVGVKTVSRVINGEPYVSLETAAKVRKAIAEVDYQPDMRAGALRRSTGSSRVIGLLLGSRNNPFSNVVQAVVEECAREQGSVLMTASLDSDPIRERQAVTSLLSHRVDGLIISTPTHDLSYLHSEQEYGVGLVLIDGDPRDLECESYTSDSRGGIELAVRHLVAHGHQRIAYLGPRHDVYTIAERREGFLSEGRRLGLRIPDTWLCDDLDMIDPAPVIMKLLMSDDRPTAIVSAQNEITVQTVRCLRSLGLENSIALVGFDDFPLADLLVPGITVVKQDVVRLATHAAESLFAQINGDSGEPRTHVLPVTLVERGSGEIPALTRH